MIDCLNSDEERRNTERYSAHSAQIHTIKCENSGKCALHTVPSRLRKTQNRSVSNSQTSLHDERYEDTDRSGFNLASTTVSQTQQALQLQGTSLEESCHHSSLITSHQSRANRMNDEHSMTYCQSE